MCFYGQELYRCGDWTWGRFSIWCTYQHRVGETWYGGGGRLKASIEKSEATVRQLEEVILGLERRRPLKGKSARPHKPPKAILPSHWGIVLPVRACNNTGCMEPGEGLTLAG
ncbi:hypothetical protein CISG_09220 [Coccidioides immitis RMSCC 3703]|uniref:Uncharacterized protein n=1 Tax=Coccidioides immitis RMSCC 3703 TaxID=454286 RepID=A0A0J8U438_COCIT|nr:hypothetical protein CISG_09220 [Coccidioides immitis RMSCC 3703]